MSQLIVVEHRESTFSRRLRRNRTKLALGIAALEGVAVLAGAIPWWGVVILALGGLVTWAAVGRTHPADAVRDLTWVLAASQLLVVLVPIATAVVLALAVVMLALFAVAALVALFLDRR